MKIVDFDDGCLEEFYKLISKNVVRIRKEKKVSQLKLANAIGHQNATFIGKAELLAEKKHFNLEHLYKISAVLDVEIEEFFKKT
ncbi:helix-turn-helix domain-containing protein [Aliarcobacter butzleri]|uniref:helix-turn-helix domain-containing protein n=1 Tax=Aliarcobacter butzleri TaxID=28197 RepID=UPI00126099EE|nr:helix-turn-helix transcriptional regulator [Aliarcobacter butzleri]